MRLLPAEACLAGLAGATAEATEHPSCARRINPQGLPVSIKPEIGELVNRHGTDIIVTTRTVVMNQEG